MYPTASSRAGTAPEKACLATILGHRTSSRDIRDWVPDVWVVRTGCSSGLQGHNQRQQKKKGETLWPASSPTVPCSLPHSLPPLALSYPACPIPLALCWPPLSFIRHANPLGRAWWKAICVALAPFTSPRVAHAPPLCSWFVLAPAPSLCTRTVRSNVRGIPVPSPRSPSLHLLRGSLWCSGALLPWLP